VSTEPEEISWSAIDERIDRAVRAEREKWQRALHGLHCEILETIRQSIEAMLTRAEGMTVEAVQQMLTVSGEMLRQFDAKVRACLAEDRILLGSNDRRMN